MAQERENDDHEVRIPVQQEKWGEHCIYKLPASITDLKKNAYKPQTISFGPYHNGSSKLRPMEHHKSRVLGNFLERAGKSKEDCIHALSGAAEQLMDAYDSLDRKWRRNPAKFLEMMITDGCFMLEVMAYSKDFKTQYDNKDPIFSDHAKQQMVPFIRRDMLMLENQLPMLLFKQLLNLGGHPKPTEPPIPEDDDYIIKLIVDFCTPFTNPPVENYPKECKHVLHVHRQLLITGKVIQRKGPSVWSKLRRKYFTESYDRYATRKFDETKKNKWLEEVVDYGGNIIPSATRLEESKITIKMSDTKSITSIKFVAGFAGGILEIPPIVVDDNTEPVFRNLLAFERLHPNIGSSVTSYVNFMDDIINNDKDVKILQNHGILSNSYGSDMAVANLFNSLSKDTMADLKSDLIRVRYRAREHCRRKWNKIWGDLIHNYFINPWTAIAVVAAILAFGIGTTDTIFSILERTQRNSTVQVILPPPTNISSLS